jgi:superfamily II DNA/RNA helicase
MSKKRLLKGGTGIIVATPGKLLAHLKSGYVNFDHIEYLVLDEADRMLDMGFIFDIMSIISYVPKKRQTILFSATMPAGIEKLSQAILKNPVKISLIYFKACGRRCSIDLFVL